MKADKFGDRMKRYENAYRYHLTERSPVILRIDGCHFHSYTKGFNKPFDQDLIDAFWETCQYLAKNVMGCKMVYHQSDEISMFLTNYDKLTTQSWFQNNLQKLVSVSASMATAKFNEVMRKKYPDQPLATFDSRAFILPLDEVTNYFLWRQQDASKNSISMVAQANFPHKDLQGLNGSQMQDKLMLEKGINWNDIPTWQKRGACIVKETHEVNGTNRRRWVVDKDIPVFSADRDYIDKYVYIAAGERLASM
jgi:tRNA(His) guanylyltransferase